MAFNIDLSINVIDFQHLKTGDFMFGMGLGEILLVVIAAIIFLGPDKLPGAMVDIAKFFKSIKKNITEAKETIEEELDIDELKRDVLDYKETIQKDTGDLYKNSEKESREIKEIFSDLKENTQKSTNKIEKKS